MVDITSAGAEGSALFILDAKRFFRQKRRLLKGTWRNVAVRALSICNHDDFWCAPSNRSHGDADV
jgi:hypothetical protein